MATITKGTRYRTTTDARGKLHYTNAQGDTRCGTPAPITPDHHDLANRKVCFLCESAPAVNEIPAPVICARPGCNRPIIEPKWAARGFGPRCWMAIQKSARDTRFSQAVQDKADTLVGERVPGKQMVLFPSSDGTTTYRATATACTCKAGLRGARNKAGVRYGCSHQRAVEKRFGLGGTFSPTRVIAL